MEDRYMNRASPIRVVIADDDPLVRMILRKVLRLQPNIELVGEAVDGTEALKLVAELKADILLLDLLMPRLPGIEALRHLRPLAVPVSTILLCASIDKRQIVEAVQLGARGVLLKESVSVLPICIEAVMNGYYWITDRKIKDIAEIMHELLGPDKAEPETPDRYKLTKRELHITALVTAGNTNREIGHLLSISEETVKRHLANVFDKVGVSSRLELAMFALDRRLVAWEASSLSR